MRFILFLIKIFFKNINNDSESEEEENSGLNSEVDEDEDENKLPPSGKYLIDYLINILFWLNLANSRLRNLRSRELPHKKDTKKSTKSKSGDNDDNNSILNRTLLPDYDGVVYTLDAKLIGNVGRYFNHSCSPNIAVQNVFVDVS